jgi:hypothetical protein
MDTNDPLLAPIIDVEKLGTETKIVGGVRVDLVRTGNGRVKRMIYPVGFNWETDLAPIIGSKYCKHAHVGFMAKGQINVKYSDGAVEEFKAPCFVAVEPEHEGWVVGDEPAVLIEFDYERDTVGRLGVPKRHS